MSAGGAPGSRSIVALGLGALAVSWLFGAVAVAVVGVGLVVAGILARLWARYRLRRRRRRAQPACRRDRRRRRSRARAPCPAPVAAAARRRLGAAARRQARDARAAPPPLRGRGRLAQGSPRAVRARAAARQHRRPARPRTRVICDGRSAGGARATSGARARCPVLGCRRPRNRRRPRVAAPAERFRAPRCPGVPGRGAVAGRALAEHRAARQADGQGARRCATRRCRRRPRRRPSRCDRRAGIVRASTRRFEQRARSSVRTLHAAGAPRSCSRVSTPTWCASAPSIANGRSCSMRCRRSSRARASTRGGTHGSGHTGGARTGARRRDVVRRARGRRARHPPP